MCLVELFIAIQCDIHIIVVDSTNPGSIKRPADMKKAIKNGLVDEERDKLSDPDNHIILLPLDFVCEKIAHEITMKVAIHVPRGYGIPDGTRRAMLHRVVEAVQREIDNQRKPIKILVIGKTRVGKSSLVSMLINGDVKSGDDANPGGIMVNDTAQGVTFNCKQFRNAQFVVTDTVGLGEDNGDDHAVRSPEAIKKLYYFLKDSKDGYNMILFVTRQSILDIDVKIFKTYFSTLFDDLACIFRIVVLG